MEVVLNTIIVSGGSSTSGEILEALCAIAPQNRNRITHSEVKTCVAKTHPYAGISINKVENSAPQYTFNNLRLSKADELARKAELCLFGIIWEEFEALTAAIKWARDVNVDDPDVERAISGFAGNRIVLAIKVRKTRMESAYGAAKEAFKIAKNCKNIAKISFVGAPFGTGTICLLASGSDDVVIHDTYEIDQGLAAKRRNNGLPNMMLLNWSYHLSDKIQNKFQLQRIPLGTGRQRIFKCDELPTPCSMWEWELHGILDAIKATDRVTSDISVIALVTDNLDKTNVINKTRQEAKKILKAFLKKAYNEDAFFYTI